MIKVKPGLFRCISTVSPPSDSRAFTRDSGSERCIHVRINVKNVLKKTLIIYELHHQLILKWGCCQKYVQLNTDNACTVLTKSHLQ